MKESKPSTEPIGQNLIRIISNVCFSVFVFSVLIFTVIAVTYQPPDPWLESAPAFTRLFTQSQNATFKIDDSVIKTGEDLQTSAVVLVPAMPPTPEMDPVSDATPPPLPKTPVTAAAPPDLATIPIAVPPESAMSPIGEPVVNKSKEKVPESPPKLVCDDTKPVNCSDPRILTAVKRFNLRAFKSIVFYEYQTPVNGSKPDECDVAWRFRNRREKSWRKYRDFRRFKFGIKPDCTYKVLHAGSWHSGVSARLPRIKLNSTRASTNPKIAPSVRDDQINDTIPTIPVTNFKKGKYLYYSRGGDYCKGMNQYLWSFLCGLGEAMYLNRTFVMDLNMCLAGTYSPSNKDEEGKDFRFYFDFEHLKETASIVEEGEFLRDWKKWDRTHKRNKIQVKKVLSHKVTPMQLKKDRSTVIWRQFDKPEPENYWYRVCEGQASKYIQRPWHAVWKSKRLMNIVSAISGRMDWDFDAVHVVRGQKAQNKQLWPHLDADTSPDALVEKLKGMIQPWRNLYIATNEPFYNYFDKLRSHFKVHLLDDYKDLWGSNSEWFNETTLLNNGRPVDFDGYMRVAVDTEVFYRAKTRVETFYNLTKDCKDGINTC